MKKTFRSILAGAVALLAVSCYDDAALRSEIDKLDDRITVLENTLSNDVSGINSLASRLSDAENAIKNLNEDLGSVEGDIADLGSLATDLAALKTQVNDLVGRLDAADGKVDGIVKDLKEAVDALIEADKNFALKADVAGALAQIAVVNVTEVNGNVVLTLADGKEVELSKPLKNVENTGLVTVIQDGAEKYWAVKGADGKVTSLGVPVGHPDVDIKFSVASNGDLQYSVNGGEPVSTGVSTSGMSGSGSVITGVTLAEDGKSVTVNVGENEFVLPIYTPSTLKLARDSFFLYYGAQKKVAIEAEDLDNVVVMNQPDGWRADVVDGYLVVTAPSAKAVAGDAAQKDGLIVLHGTNCVTASVEVTTGPGLEMTLEDGILNFRNAFTSVQLDELGDVIGEGFGEFYVGIVPYDALEEIELSEYFQYIYDNYEAPWGMGSIGLLSNCYLIDMPVYKEGVCEVQSVSISVSDFYDWIAWDDEDGIDAGVKYLLYAAPVDAEDEGHIMLSELITLDYTLLLSEISIGGITHDNALFNLNLKGATKYIVGLTQDPSVLYGPAITLEMVMNEMPPWAYIKNGYVDYIEGGVYTDGQYEGVSAKELNYGEPLVAGSKYYYWAFPYVEGVVYSDFATQFYPYVKEFETLPLQSGGPATELVEGAKAYDKVSVTITAVDGADVRYNFFTASQWANFDEDEDAIRAELLDAGYMLTSPTVTKSCNPATTYVCAAISISADGKYGEVNYISVPRKSAKQVIFQ